GRYDAIAELQAEPQHEQCCNARQRLLEPGTEGKREGPARRFECGALLRKRRLESIEQLHAHEQLLVFEEPLFEGVTFRVAHLTVQVTVDQNVVLFRGTWHQACSLKRSLANSYYG